jgi:hypothetical protein
METQLASLARETAGGTMAATCSATGYALEFAGNAVLGSLRVADALGAGLATGTAALALQGVAPAMIFGGALGFARAVACGMENISAAPGGTLDLVRAAGVSAITMGAGILAGTLIAFREMAFAAIPRARETGVPQTLRLEPVPPRALAAPPPALPPEEDREPLPAAAPAPAALAQTPEAALAEQAAAPAAPEAAPAKEKKRRRGPAKKPSDRK